MSLITIIIIIIDLRKSIGVEGTATMLNNKQCSVRQMINMAAELTS